jgi:hypothetical protein
MRIDDCKHNLRASYAISNAVCRAFAEQAVAHCENNLDEVVAYLGFGRGVACGSLLMPDQCVREDRAREHIPF